MAYYRTRTYIAADWTGDIDAIMQLRSWNDSSYWSLNFTDAHDLTQARDSSLSCSIKASLRERLDASKTFVLIVGKSTKDLRSGSCSYCNDYSIYSGCRRGYSYDFRSFINFECEKAVRDHLKIVVLYNAASIDRSKCPDAVKNIGTHVPMKKYRYEYGRYDWDYQAVKHAIMD